MIRRAIPEPFRRPRIDLDKVRREWKWILPTELKDGDILQDFGKVGSLKIHSESTVQVFHGLHPKQSKYLDARSLVYAFTTS